MFLPSHRVGFLRHLGLKTGMHFASPFWSRIGYGFQGTMGVYERIYRFNTKLVRKKEKYVNAKWM